MNDFARAKDIVKSYGCSVIEPGHDLNTVNIIEISDVSNMSVSQLFSFADDKDGNKKAEEIFRRIVREHLTEPVDDETLDSYLEDGCFEVGNFWIGIVHSTKG
jgi:hypothetical protein